MRGARWIVCRATRVVNCDAAASYSQTRNRKVGSDGEANALAITAWAHAPRALPENGLKIVQKMGPTEDNFNRIHRIEHLATLADLG